MNKSYKYKEQRNFLVVSRKLCTFIKAVDLESLVMVLSLYVFLFCFIQVIGLTLPGIFLQSFDRGVPMRKRNLYGF
jgi:hypothetical protein